MKKNTSKNLQIKDIRQIGGRGIKKKRTHADMGDGGQAKVDVHIWFKI